MGCGVANHNNDVELIDHRLKVQTYANMIVEHEFSDDDDMESIQELIQLSEEIRYILACYVKHKLGKSTNMGSIECPLCYECVSCECRTSD